MEAHLTRTFLHQFLEDAEYQKTPTYVGRLFMLIIPLVMTAIAFITLHKRIEEIVACLNIYPQSSHAILRIVKLISFFGLLTIGTYELFQDNGWTTKAWVLFVLYVACTFFRTLIFSHGSNSTTYFCFFLTLLSVIFAQQLWVELGVMPEDSQGGSSNWKHVCRNIIGWAEVGSIFSTSFNLGYILIYAFDMTKRHQAYFFWITTPFVLIGLVVLNLIKYGPFIDEIGYLISAVLILILCAISTHYNLKNSEREQLSQ